MSLTSRRTFLKAAGVVSAGFLGMRRAVAAAERDDGTLYGPLQSDPHQLLELPEGFTYRVISKVGEEMDDGLFVPALHDGMAAFAGPGGRTILVRNHEGDADPPRHGPFGWTFERLERISRDRIYDFGRGNPCVGGTTTLVYDTKRQRLERHFLSLAGTSRNCAGGPTPWGSWISCEESVRRADGRFEKDHGYNFEVPASPDIAIAAPVPLTAMGRFNHEAVAVDPKSGIVYQTEDAGDGLIYRYIPARRGRLTEGGRLQALCLRDRPSADTTNWNDEEGRPVAPRIEPGSRHAVRWVDLEDIQAPENDLRLRGFATGAARFARGEGMWYGRSAVYFACTSGGHGGKGQVWRYVPSPSEGLAAEQREPGTLELFIEPNDGALVENCDNLTIAPWGDVVLAEDGPGEQFIVGVRPDGRTYRFARNAAGASEMAGPTFSPDGTTLFLNIQGMGVTLAVTGPWARSG